MRLAPGDEWTGYHTVTLLGWWDGSNRNDRLKRSPWSTTATSVNSIHVVHSSQPPGGLSFLRTYHPGTKPK